MEITIKLTAPPELCEALDALAKLIGSTVGIKPEAEHAQTSAQAPAPMTPVTQNPIAPIAPSAPAVPVVSAPGYTIDQLATAGAALVDAGKMEQLLALLARYNVAAVTQLQPNQFGAFATELRALGAQI